jgi:arginine decarboxylase
VIAQRNSHASLVDGLVLSGGQPSFVAPEYDVELGMANGVTPDSVAAALRAAPDARAVFLVSPTYYGMVADVPGCAEVCHAAGVPLVVDQAWGPHFGFHPDLPRSAASQGADAVLTSTHKIAGSFTQSAMLHVVDAERIDVGAVARAIRLLRTTSPSSLLLASLDAARRQLAVHGEAILHETLAAVRRTREKLASIGSVRLIGEEQVGQPGVVGWDPMRIAIDVRGTGCSGYDIADALRQSYDAQPELATHATIVLVVGIGERPEALERVAGDFDEVVKRIERPGTAETVVRPPAAFGHEMAVPPRDAFLGDAQLVEVDDAVGRISCESIAGYPPGVPVLLPGERITTEIVSYLRELVSSGARLHGASDPAFRTINTLSESGT